MERCQIFVWKALGEALSESHFTYVVLKKALSIRYIIPLKKSGGISVFVFDF